jgi:hypothetical protein
MLDHLLRQKNIAALHLPPERRGDWIESCTEQVLERWREGGAGIPR